MNTQANYERSWPQQAKAEAKELYTEIMERDLYGCLDSAALHALTDKAELAAEMKFNRLTLQYARGDKAPELKHLRNWLKQRRPHYEWVFLASHPTAAFTEALSRHLNAAPARADDSQKSPVKPRGRPPSDEVKSRAAERRKVVMPILDKFGWTRCHLADKAGVGKNSVYEYLDGTRRRITPENRKAISRRSQNIHSEASGLSSAEVPRGTLRDDNPTHSRACSYHESGNPI